MQAVKLGVVMGPAEVENVREASVAYALRSAVAKAAGVPHSLVFIASVVDSNGKLTVLEDNDPANTAGDATGGADDDLNTLSGGEGRRALQELAAQRHYALQRATGQRGSRSLALALAPGGAAAAATTPAGGLTVTLNVVAGTGAAAASASAALAGAGDVALTDAPLQALAAAMGAPYPGNFTGGLVKGGLSVVTLTRRRTRWGALVAFFASLSVGVIVGIAAGVAACMGLVGWFVWRRVRRAKEKLEGAARVAPEPQQEVASPVGQSALRAAPRSKKRIQRQAELAAFEAQWLAEEEYAAEEAAAAEAAHAGEEEEEEAEEMETLTSGHDFVTRAEANEWEEGTEVDSNGEEERHLHLPPPQAPRAQLLRASPASTWAQRRSTGALPPLSQRGLNPRGLPPLRGRLRGTALGGEVARHASPLSATSVPLPRQGGGGQFTATASILKQSQAMAAKAKADAGGRTRVVRRGGRLLPGAAVERGPWEEEE